MVPFPTPILTAFADVIGALWHPDSCEAVNPTRFRAVFQKYVPSFSGYRWESWRVWDFSLALSGGRSPGSLILSLEMLFIQEVGTDAWAEISDCGLGRSQLPMLFV